MATSKRTDALRAFFATYVAALGRATDPRVAAAFAAVPREVYAGPGPWSIHVVGHGPVGTPSADVAFLYQDTLVAIDVARGINIGQPSLHARCLDALSIRAGETVLHVGAGVGYYTALLAHLVGPDGRVYAVEIEPDLAERAGRNLGHLPWVSVDCRSGLAPDLPAADIVYVNAGLPDVPEPWLRALRPGGRLLFPFQPVGAFGGMLRVDRPDTGDVWPARFISRAAFIGCQGGQDEEVGKRVASAFRSDDWREVRSLRFDADTAPDASCWVRGNGWWLSRAEPGQPIVLPNPSGRSAGP